LKVKAKAFYIQRNLVSACVLGCSSTVWRLHPIWVWRHCYGVVVETSRALQPRKWQMTDMNLAGWYTAAHYAAIRYLS